MGMFNFKRLSALAVLSTTAFSMIVTPAFAKVTVTNSKINAVVVNKATEIEFDKGTSVSKINFNTSDVQVKGLPGSTKIVVKSGVNPSQIEGLSQVQKNAAVKELTLAQGSKGQAGDEKITGLTSHKKYVVVVDNTVNYVKADGTLSATEGELAALTGTEITSLDNSKIYKVIEVPAQVTLAGGSEGTAGDATITGLADGTTYKVTVTDALGEATAMYTVANGTLTATKGDKKGLTNGAAGITGLKNYNTYKVEVEAVPTVKLDQDSKGQAGNKKITGLTSKKYVVVVDNTVNYV
ncbi:hypothetical protein B9C88_22815, partial [Brevibacillus laterosporus]|uniref:hypothetical protein n=1 Tax=Brevibacillus laterosporus TaxID=1465 RepID=UPI000BD50781